MCSLCHKREVKNVEHFIGVCPVLVGIRRKWFGCNDMGVNDVAGYLNGRDLGALVGYLREKKGYRRLLVEEFTY